MLVCTVVRTYKRPGQMMLLLIILKSACYSEQYVENWMKLCALITEIWTGSQVLFTTSHSQPVKTADKMPLWMWCRFVDTLYIISRITAPAHHDSSVSESSAGDLVLSCNSPSFEDLGSEQESTQEMSPHQFEPYLSGEEISSENEGQPSQNNRQSYQLVRLLSSLCED